MSEMSKYPVIDTHYHVGISGGGCNKPSDMFEWMARYRIDTQIVMQLNEGTAHETPGWNPCLGNDFIAKLQKENPKKVIGIGGVLPWWQPPRKYMFQGDREGGDFDLVTDNPVLAELDRIILDLGLWGLKVHPLEHHYQINSPYIMFPIFERMTELQKKTGRKLMVFSHAASDDIGNTPEAVADAARRFPELLFIVSHSAYPRGVPTLVSVLGDLGNVMLDLTTFAAPNMLRDAFRHFGAERFCSGSDGPFASGTVKEAIVKSLTEDEEERALILGGNLLNYFKFY
jgi:hypothetical protein